MIETQELTKHFKDVRAVDGINLTVAPGELVALLGPNGAGKSTTLRMLTTLIPPTSGSARVAGFDVVRQQRQVRLRIGYIGQGNGAGHSQRGRDELISQGRAYGLRAAEARKRAAELIDSLGLGEVADRTVSTLSGGQRRRLDIAMGLIHAPELLFLDEPSTGLDPQNRANLQEHILALRARHETTIVLTTHYLDEADSMAERVIVVDHGRIIADDTPERLKAEHVGDRITLGFDHETEAARAASVLDASIGLMPGRPGPAGSGGSGSEAPGSAGSAGASGETGETGATGATGSAESAGSGPGRPGPARPGRIHRYGTRLEISVAGAPRLVPGIIEDLRAAGVGVAEVEVTRPTLDDVFLNLTGRSLREGGAATEPDIAVARTDELVEA